MNHRKIVNTSAFSPCITTSVEQTIQTSSVIIGDFNNPFMRWEFSMLTPSVKCVKWKPSASAQETDLLHSYHTMDR